MLLMDVVIAVVCVLAVTVAIVAILWLGGLDVIGPMVLQRTVEPFTRWFMRVVCGIDRPLVGVESLVGVGGTALSDFAPETGQSALYLGRVQVRAESWSAHSHVPIHAGCSIRVISWEGIVLDVEPTSSI